MKSHGHPMHHEQLFDWEDTLEECKTMGAMYVQAIMDSLNKRFFCFIYMSSMHQNFMVQSIIQVMKKLVSPSQSNGWRD